jgi:hypothetical protein
VHDRKCSSNKCAVALTPCDDKNPCTDDFCDSTKGCQNLNNTATCDDTDKCTEAMFARTANVRSRRRAVTTATLHARPCDPTKGCANVAANVGTVCTDGSVCTLDDACDGKSACKAGASVTCNDNLVCTSDSCDAIKGCVFTNNTASCDDGNKCTDTDTCASNKCVGKTKACDDNKGNTVDFCDGGTGNCQNILVPGTCAIDAECNDQNPCTTEMREQQVLGGSGEM